MEKGVKFFLVVLIFVVVFKGFKKEVLVENIIDGYIMEVF